MSPATKKTRGRDKIAQAGQRFPHHLVNGHHTMNKHTARTMTDTIAVVINALGFTPT